MDGMTTATDIAEAEAGRAPARRDARRDAILEAATELFLEAGFEAASIDRIVARVGGSKSTVYAYFGNKAGLFAAVVERVLEELGEATWAEGEGSLGLKAGLRAIGLRLLRLVTSERHVALSRLVIAESRRFPEIGRIYYERGPRVAYGRLASFLAEHAARGEAAIEDPRGAADWFAGKLLHRSFLERLCLEQSTLSQGEMRQIVDEAVSGVLRLYGTVSGEENDAKGEAGCD